MKITIEIELRGSIWSWDQVAEAIQATAGTFSDSEATLEVGDRGFIFTDEAEDVGQFIVREGLVADFHSLDSEAV